MPTTDRRTVLKGLGAGMSALALSRIGASAQPAGTPPAAGPLSAGEIGALLAAQSVPGACLAILDGKSPPVVHCYGLARAGADMAVTPHTRFQAASISKTVNALVVLRLVEAGRLALDDAVNAHLKSWRLPDNALTAKTPVTVRMLLSHTGGTTVPGFSGYDRGAPLPSLPQVLDGALPANSAPVRVAWPPGEAFRYSGGGTSVLEQMVIDIAGEPYPAALERLVLRPLGMRESSFVQPPDAGTLAQAAFAHSPEGAPVAGGFKVHPEHAAAGLWTTASDLARMIAAVMASRNAQPGAFLDPALARAMLTPVASGAALGAFVNAEGIFSHPGFNIGFRAIYFGDPASGRGIVLMTNGDNGARLFMPFRRRVAEAYSWPWLLSSSPSP